MTVATKEYQQDLFDGSIIPSRLAITAMRDSGYKNTAYALAELVDNAQQAGASVIEVLCLQKRERIHHRERSRLSRIAVLDNGEGMDYATLHIALQFGNGKYLKNRSGSAGLEWPTQCIYLASGTGRSVELAERPRQRTLQLSRCFRNRDRQYAACSRANSPVCSG